MPRETHSGGGELEGKDKAPVLDDVDKLIAAAEVAAGEALRATASEEVKAVQTKKKMSAEAAEKAEQLQQRFSALKADDAFVEDYGYEWILGAYEAETGIAAPNKAVETIAALRRTGDALRKLAGVESKTLALLKKMEDLQRVHDELFEQIQTMTVDALDAVKKKYTGEETEFEKKYQQLRESPLMRGIEYDPNTPEAREEALKQGIEEVMMRPFVESSVKPFQKKFEDDRKKIADAQSKWQAIKDDPKNARDDLQIRNYRANELIQESHLVIRGDYQGADGLEKLFKLESDKLDVFEKQVIHDAIVVDANRTIINDSLREVHDEAVLRDALVDLDTFLSSIRERAKTQERFGQNFPKLKTDLGKAILGRYMVYGATRQVRSGSYEERITKTPGTQLSDEVSGFNHEDDGRAYFLASRLPDVPKDEWKYLHRHQGNSTPESVAAHYKQNQAEIARSSKEKGRGALVERYPTVESAVNAVFGGEGHYLNLQRAHTKVRGYELPKLSPELAAAGWKESSLGAWVAPEENTRKVDREYAQMLERLSKPQIDVERAFDVHGPEGEFHVYTTEQAVDLLRRARRDARDLVFKSERAVAEARVEIEGDKLGREGLEAQVKRLEGELEANRKAAKTREQEITDRLRREGDEARKSATEYLNEEVRRIAQQRDALQARLQDVHSQLDAALQKKPGLFGGDKELRQTVEEARAKLRGQ